MACRRTPRTRTIYWREVATASHATLRRTTPPRTTGAVQRSARAAGWAEEETALDELSQLVKLTATQLIVAVPIEPIEQDVHARRG